MAVNIEKFQEVGYLQNTHGLKGEMRIKISVEFQEDMLLSEKIFFEINGQMIPYFIDELRSPGNWIIKLEDIDTPEQARSLQGIAVHLERADILLDEERTIIIEKNPFAHLVGYNTFDGDTSIGEILEIREMPGQTIAVLNREGKEVFIPLVKPFIVEIKDDAKTLHLNLPDGILDL